MTGLPAMAERRVTGSEGLRLSSWSWPLVLGVLFSAAHLPSLAPALEDIDSINFALALHDYDPTDNRPHPPGYPVYIAIGKLFLWLVGAASYGIDSIQQDAIALSLFATVGGGVAVAALYFVARSLAPRSPLVPPVAAVLLAVSPLFWLTSLRPMSDVPGLAAALVTQGLLLRGLHDPQSLVIGAFAAGLTAGMRSQSVWLTVPLLGYVLWTRRRSGVRWLMTGPVAAFIAAGLVWAIPMVVAAGGPERYLQALGGQAGDDFASVDMLWRDLTARHVARALHESLVLPWSSELLANAVGIAAAIGGLAMLIRERRQLAILLLAFAPYAVFHLMLQETLTIRYALPLVPAVALLAARAFQLAGRAGPIAAGALAIGALVVAVPGGIEYGRQPHPAFVAIREMVAAGADARPAAVFAHHALGRSLDVEAASTLPVVTPALLREWLGPVDYWRGGGSDPIWFLADARRAGLSLIDPAVRRNVKRFEWDIAERPELGGTRPLGVDWYRITAPGWFAGTGWSLDLEAGGLTAAEGSGPDRRPIEAYVRRRAEPAWIMVGGRDLAAPASRPSILEMRLDGDLVEQWRHDPATGANFLRIVSLPAGIPAGQGLYATLTILTRAEAEGAPTPPVAIRQFDVQSAGGLMSGFGEGWHEEEYEAATGRRWRWTSDRSILRVAPPQAIEIVIRGESPLKYYDAPPVVRVTAAGQEIANTRPADDFEWRVTVPADAVRRAEGAVAIEMDRVYLPSERDGSSDMRRLGLRLHEVTVHPVSP